LLACKHVDVFSPNHLELAKLFEDDDQISSGFDREAIESYAERCLGASDEGSQSQHDTSMVIRAGEHGAMTLSRSTKSKWYPPFHDPKSTKIVDTTGAGNMFLGAFAVALQMSGNLGEAAAYGTVAASFAVEQIGLLTRGVDGPSETWHGTTFASRLREYKERIA
jgi:sugar/nucleoside kinase (ribokinase family)